MEWLNNAIKKYLLSEDEEDEDKKKKKKGLVHNAKTGKKGPISGRNAIIQATYDEAFK